MSCTPVHTEFSCIVELAGLNELVTVDYWYAVWLVIYESNSCFLYRLQLYDSNLQIVDKSIWMLQISPIYFILSYNFSKCYHEVNSYLILIIFLSAKAEKYVFSLN